MYVHKMVKSPPVGCNAKFLVVPHFCAIRRSKLNTITREAALKHYAIVLMHAPSSILIPFQIIFSIYKKKNINVIFYRNYYYYYYY